MNTTTTSDMRQNTTSTSNPFARGAIIAGKRVELWTPLPSRAGKLDQPLRWRKPRMVFVNSMSDLFHERVPDKFIDRVYGVMGGARAHTFQILTKRPERALAYYQRWAERIGDPEIQPLPNVWLGVSIENARYTWRAELLKEIPAAIRFVSAEPLLGSLFEFGDSQRDREETYER